MEVSREQVLHYRVRAQQLDREPGQGRLDDTAVLDYGVQDTGPDGGRWALAIRGLDTSDAQPGDLVLFWTTRGAPHFYRRSEVNAVAAAVAPFSDADAAKRIFDASKPLREAGIEALAALDTIATTMRRVVTDPTVKGEVSTQVTALLPPPYLRFCRPCQATHPYEQAFRLGATRAGLELRPGTSPPVLARVPGFAPAATVDPAHDVIRAHLRLFGPATPKQVAEFLDSPVAEVRSRWPDDTVEVTVAGERRWLLAADQERLTAEPTRVTRLLGPYDLFLQTRDRSLLVNDPARAKALWPVLGRPGAVLSNGEIAGVWRPRTSGKRLTVQVELWQRDTTRLREAITKQAGRLATYRGITSWSCTFS